MPLGFARPRGFLCGAAPFRQPSWADTGDFPDVRERSAADHRFSPPQEPPMLTILMIAAAGTLIPALILTITDRKPRDVRPS
jgi:hypothetical protein